MRDRRYDRIGQRGYCVLRFLEKSDGKADQVARQYDIQHLSSAVSKDLTTNCISFEQDVEVIVRMTFGYNFTVATYTDLI